MDKLKELEDEINSIKERNKRVELDKAWETSLTRKIIISLLTYFVVTLFFVVAKLPKPFINSLIPTLGFLLSTLTIPVFKKIWLNRYSRNKK
jgi:hypothetical protein